MSIPELIGASLTSLLFIWLINKYIFKKWLKLSKSLLKTWFTWLIISTFIGMYTMKKFGRKANIVYGAILQYAHITSNTKNKKTHAKALKELTEN